jgi:CHAT domain-containing protein/Tfp pilus assembly protein PilF
MNMHIPKYLYTYYLGFIFFLFLFGCAGSELTTAEWFTHAQFSSMSISKGDILLKEGIKKRDQGDYDGAFSKWFEAAEFYRKHRKEKHLVTVYNLFGYAYLDTNAYDRSLKYFRDAQTLSKKVKYQEGILDSIIGRANTYSQLGDTSNALDHFKNALVIAEKLNNQIKQVAILEGMGTIYLNQKEYSQTLSKYKRSLAIAERSSDQNGIQSSLNGIGITLMGMGSYDKAIGYFNRSLVIAKERNDIHGIVDNLNNLGMCYKKLKNYVKGISSFREGLSIASALGLHFPEKNLYAHYGIGTIYEKKKNPFKAAKNYKLAIDEIEAIRGKIESGEYRSGFLENKIVVYEDLIDLLISEADTSLTQKGKKDPILDEFTKYGKTHTEIAFFFTESTKARSFLEAIAKGKYASVEGRIPKELEDQEKKLTGFLTALQAGRSHTKEEMGGKRKSQKKEIEKAKKDLEEFIHELKINYPDYAAIRYPEPVRIHDIPLQDNEVLLEFKVNSNDTYLWVLRKEKLVSFIKIDIGKEKLSKKIWGFREPLEDIEKINDFDPKKGEQLFRLLLQRGLAGVSKKDHIIIVPDGPLYLLPFEALTTNTSKFIKKIDPSTGIASFERIQYMGDQYKISYYPSASIMAVLRRGRTIETTSKPLFALGDPIYDEDDPRYKKYIAQKGIDNKTNTAFLDNAGEISLRDIIVTSGFSIARLPETRDEVLKIGALFDYSEISPHIKIDMNANENEIKNSDLLRYRYVHLATHGILSGDIPYILEPALVMNQVENNEDDGFLKMSEVLALKLNADMVVLSACKTALGKEMTGEGIVGLSRAFMLAGARSVIVSLWSVDSNSTAALMKRFYTYLQSGKPKEEALRLAKHDLKETIYTVNRGRGIEVHSLDEKIHSYASHPFFWASFILMGEWE